MLTETAMRAEKKMAECINEDIRRKTERNISCYIAAGGKKIDERLAELDREWELERVMQMQLSAMLLSTLSMTVLSGKKWLIIPFAAAGCLMQHALKGWCPVVPVLRRLGVRTRSEINSERQALKLLRGDYQNLPDRNKESDTQAAEILLAQQK